MSVCVGVTQQTQQLSNDEVCVVVHVSKDFFVFLLMHMSVRSAVTSSHSVK